MIGVLLQRTACSFLIWALAGGAVPPQDAAGMPLRRKVLRETENIQNLRGPLPNRRSQRFHTGKLF